MFQRHVSGALDGPLVVLLEQNGADEADDDYSPLRNTLQSPHDASEPKNGVSDAGIQERKHVFAGLISAVGHVAFNYEELIRFQQPPCNDV